MEGQTSTVAETGSTCFNQEYRIHLLLYSATCLQILVQGIHLMDQALINIKPLSNSQTDLFCYQPTNATIGKAKTKAAETQQICYCSRFFLDSGQFAVRCPTQRFIS
ncbi:hypothetical protein ILYODFUR_000104 [Ilyodon furcidens]|uniref:Uncharacterized protein n=1 Tax=Ilyodon furcidens TaxID=33524 RepID=A0ABV0T6Q1_9TELE